MMEAVIFEQLAPDLALVKDRLSHTVWWVDVSVDVIPSQTAKITFTLTSDAPTDPFYTVICCGVARATCVLWQLCAIALWHFSLDAFPPPPWER